MARYELTEGRSNKFWEVVVEGARLTTTYGRVGSAGRSTAKAFASAAAAKAAAATLVASKQAKGYVEVGTKAKATAKAKAAPRKVAAKAKVGAKAKASPRTGGAAGRREPASSPACLPSHAFVTDVLALASDYDDRLMSSRDDDRDDDDDARVRALWERHQAHGGLDGVAWDDGAVPRELRERLQGHVDRLLAEERPDYHPGSGKHVRDVVHPSLFPFVKGRTKLVRGATPPPEPEPGARDSWGRPYERSRYQWLPTPIAVDRSGEVKILSYVNNLDRNVYPEVYDDLAALLGVMLPLFESVVGYAKAVTFFDREVPEHELPEGAARRRASAHAPRVALRGRTLQVITKIVEYRIGTKPFESVWHVEGMSHENILATGVYVLDRDPALEGAALQLKRAYTRDEAGLLFWNIAQCRSSAMNAMIENGTVPVGTLATPAGRLLVFPNSHIHRLTPMRATGGAKQATRRVIVAWLVDPERPIVSTREVRPQQGTMPRAEAEEHRLALMQERKLHKQSLNVRAVSLCEH